MKKYLNIILIALIILISVSCNPAPKGNEAFIMSKQFVEVSMSRNDLSFPFADFRFDDIKNGGFIVESYFEAANDFGVKQKVNYRVKMQFKSGDWKKLENWDLKDIKVW